MTTSTTNPPPEGAPEPGGAPPSGRYGTFAALRYRNYRYLWMGQISHAGALWMEQIARPFLILEITGGSAAHLGAVIAVRTLPQLIFGVWAGVIADRFDRRRVLLLDKSGVLAMNVIFAALVITGLLELWHIYLFSFLRGSLMAFDQPARQALIPTLVPADGLTNAVALMSATQNTMRIVGATMGGLVYGAFGASGAFSMVAVIYVGAVVSTYLLRTPSSKREGALTPTQMWEDLKEGAIYAVGHPAIRGILILSLVYYTFGMSYMQVFAPLFAERVLEIGSSGFGLMSALTGVGALSAALVIANRQPDRIGRILPLVVAGFGVMLIFFSLSTYLPRPAGLLVPLALIMVVGSLQTSYFSLSNAMLLHTAPEEMRGRVVSLLSLDRAMISAGASAAGLLADARGVQFAQIAYAAVCIAGGVAMFTLAREFRRARASDPPPEKREAAEAKERTTTAAG